MIYGITRSCSNFLVDILMFIPGGGIGGLMPGFPAPIPDIEKALREFNNLIQNNHFW